MLITIHVLFVLGNNRSPDSSKQYTQESPDYRIISSDMLISFGIAAILMISTIIGIVVTANTQLSELGLLLFDTLWILGVLVFGALLSLGRFLGMKSDMKLAVIGSVICIFAYSWFGGTVLTMYEVSLYDSIISITSLVTVVILFGVLALVYSTSRSYEFMGSWSAKCFIVGLLVSAVGSFVPLLTIVAFGLFLIGFVLDLVYEVWMVSDNKRTPAANGVAVYVAFAGTFVHVMQIVASVLSE